MFYEVMADVTDSIKTLGGLKAIRPSIESYTAAVARINAQKKLPDYIKLIAECTAGDGAAQDFIFFDTNEVSDIENGANVTTSTDFPGGMDALIARLKIRPIHFAGIQYEASHADVYGGLALRSVRVDGQDVIFKNVQSQFIDAGRVNDGLVDGKLRSVAIFGEMSYETGLAGKIARGRKLEIMLQIVKYNG